VANRQIEDLDRIAEGYDPSDPSKSFDYWFKRFEADAISPWLAGSSILELGGATGELTSLLCGDVDRYTVVEGSRLNAAVLRDRLPSVTVVEGLWEEYEPADSFSDIVLFEALEHYVDPVSLLERCSGWLDPGGRIHISVPNGQSLHRRVAVAMGSQSTPEELVESDRAQGHLRNYSLAALTADVEAAGLRVVHARGLYLKLVPNRMMTTWPEDLVRAINSLAADRPEEAAELFVVCER
jgi:SAM-dependent methyltransferase